MAHVEITGLELVVYCYSIVENKAIASPEAIGGIYLFQVIQDASI